MVEKRATECRGVFSDMSSPKIYPNILGCILDLDTDQRILVNSGTPILNMPGNIQECSGISGAGILKYQT